MISEDAAAALDDLAADARMTRADVVRQALRYAVRHTGQWLPGHA